MGDDTWTTVFPDAFERNMSFPYDSFNVEDLHTVDEGVIKHIFPLLQDSSKPWDFLIGHFLGVDHVGHRVGPDHPTMKTKLEQMDRVLRDIVDTLDSETLLILMGDHGMDRKGDHGGDTDHETLAALWFYSKGQAFMHTSTPIPLSLLPEATFPDASISHRHVQQIDLVASLALLLGLPIPYNNLGTIIPELFWDAKDGGRFKHAIELNARQVKLYLDTYRNGANGAELDGGWPKLQKLWSLASTSRDTKRWAALNEYTDAVLSICRELWAQFNISLIGMGLTILTSVTFTSWGIWSRLRDAQADWEEVVTHILRRGTLGAGLGIALGSLSMFFRQALPAHPLQMAIFSGSLLSIVAVIPLVTPRRSDISVKSLPLPLILHAAAFGSNSFTVWEDRIITYLLTSTLIPNILVGVAAPTSRLRWRILGFSTLFILCIRLMATSTVCREEQQPYCRVTFFASAALTAPPLPALILCLPTAFLLPWAIRRFLRISQSDKGVAAIFLPWIMPAALLQATVSWLLEWLEVSSYMSPEWAPSLRTYRTLVSWSALLTILAAGGSLWQMVPLCLQVSTNPTNAKEAGKDKKQIVIVGFANAFGSPYLIFWCIVLGIYYMVSQPTAQVVLGLATLAILCHLEVVDSVRDVRALNAAFSSATPSTALDGKALPQVSITFGEIAPLALLALHTFYATGHQSTISSIQWKVAFVLTPTLTYPISMLLVILNTFGPQFLLALAVPLVALWNQAPLPLPVSITQVRRESVRASIGMMLYHSTLLLGSAFTAAWLRRHLMVWKIFAPRYLNTAATLLAVDAGLLLGVGIGIRGIAVRIGTLFGHQGSTVPGPVVGT